MNLWNGCCGLTYCTKLEQVNTKVFRRTFSLRMTSTFRQRPYFFPQPWYPCALPGLKRANRLEYSNIKFKTVPSILLSLWHYMYISYRFVIFEFFFSAIRQDSADGGPACDKSSINTEQHKDTQMKTRSHALYGFRPRNSSAGKLLESSQTL